MEVYKRLYLTMLFIVALLPLTGCDKKGPAEASAASTSPARAIAAKKKVLFIDSYHKGYEWSDGVLNGALLTFNAEFNDDDTVDNSKSKVELKIFRMDTKRNPSEEWKQSAGLKAKDLIETWKPDLVITSDDHAAKYVIVPYYKNTTLPFVFCGINWDAKQYGLPCSNVTGMVEVADFKGMIDGLKEYSHGERVGFMTGNRYSDFAMGEKSQSVLGITYDKTYYVPTIEEWKERFLSLQDDVDILILENYMGIEGWEPAEVEAFILKNVKIPIATPQEFMMPYSLIGYVKIPEEQGSFAAKAALEILNGKSPTDIPVKTNEKLKIYLNMKMAKKLGIVFPIELVNGAELVN